MVQPALTLSEVDSLGLYGGWVHFKPGAVVDSHRHDDGDELLWISCGSLVLDLEGRSTELVAGRALRIPRGALHGATIGPDGLSAVQVYVPGAPGMRFYQ